MIPQGPRLAPKRALDPAIAEVLRAEAAREAQRRRQESAELLEEQQEFSLTPGAAPSSGDGDVSAVTEDAPEAPSDPIPDPPDDTRTPEKDDTPDLALASSAMASRTKGRFSEATREPVPRRDLLPDIEEINSSLRAKGADGTDERKIYTPEQTQEYKRHGRGFRLGFSVVLILATACVLVYGFAPKISATAPRLTPWLEIYVAEVNAARTWMNIQIVSGTEAFTALLARITN